MKKTIQLILAIAVLGTGCKKFLDINQNPNAPQTVTPNVVLSAALANTAVNAAEATAGSFVKINNWMGYWSRSGNFVPDVNTETYNIPNNYTDADWNAYYLNLNSYDYIEKTGHANNLPFYIAAAKTMKAFNFATLVDMYNDIPYSEAFDVENNVRPKYDDAQTIYNDLVSQLDSAIDYFEKAKDFYSVAPDVTLATDDQYDIMFGNGGTNSLAAAVARLTMWQKFANTEKLKLLVHQSEIPAQASFIQTEINKTIDIGYLAVGESAAVNPGYAASAGQQNPFYGTFFTLVGPSGAQTYFRANTYAVNFYESTGDVRQAYFYDGNTLTPGSNYDGDPASVPNSATSGIGPGVLKGNSQDQLILSDFESLFLQAEAAQRGWIPGSAQSFYESAVTQNFVYLYKDYDDVDNPVSNAKAYLSGHLLGVGPQKDVNWNATPDKLELILTQKWAAENSINWLEAYTDYRRTGFPTTEWLDISHAGTHIEPKIPIRLLYPQSEYNTNGSNVPALPNNAQFTEHIFWDK